MSKKVFLGVGHGGTDSGAIGNGFKEKDLNLSIALACNAELTRHGVTVLMSRTKDENDTLSEECKECNAFAPDLAVDIHNNAGSKPNSGDGAEVFYHYKGGTGKTLAVNILDEIVKIGQNSRGAKTRVHTDGKDWYGFIRNTDAPAVIVECAFVDNAKDIQIIDTEAERKTMGIAIAKGILKTLGIEYEAEDKPEPVQKPKGDYTLSFRYLRKGDKGEDVKALQTLLKAKGYDLGTAGDKHDGIDGDFGTKTEAAVIAYQKDNGLDADGIVGEKTMGCLMGV